MSTRGGAVEVTRLVVADADAPTRNLVQLTFAAPAWSVREAVDATGAIRLVGAQVPDVLVVDVDLPGAGGLATARALRQQPQTAGVAVVALADATRQVDPQDAAGAGVGTVLARPFGPMALYEAVERALGRA